MVQIRVAPKTIDELRAIIAEHELLRERCIFADELAQKQLQEKLERHFGQRRHDYWADEDDRKRSEDEENER